ncbi:NERD domain-containing protein [Reinekea marinisedimentorum]|uniref:Nuclease-like protein n=1 Tax=Reinekea marinisedimentorum TaxID=230495 RepID=A0A4V2UJN1_9GAMM|nr:NERD domain-containing protein [Reinekea marinisedimentorum]TCS40418.1 nuclease-like protein [Reinekea marinisedimentorum]
MIVKDKKDIEASNQFEAAGNRQEKSIAFYLRRAFKMHEEVFVFHDLNITYGGEFAQIDHLILYRYGFIIIESKSISGEVKVNAEGEWSRSYQGKWKGISSPLKQVELQADLLKKLLDANAKNILGKILFNTLQCRFGGRRWDFLCAISSSSIISRENAPKDIADKMVKSEFVSEKVIEIMNLPKNIIEKAKSVMDERAAFPAGELSNICKFLLAVDKKTLELKAVKEQNNQSIREVAQVVDVPLQPEPVGSATSPTASIRCKQCVTKSQLEGKWGKYGYYVHCEQCGTNTSMKTHCSSCESGNVRIRKSGAEFFARCEDCGVEVLVHRNV